MARIEAVVFDMDGVLFDSEQAILDCWQIVADKHGLPDVRTACFDCIGVNAELTRTIMLEHFGKDFPYDTYKQEVSGLFHELYRTGRIPVKTGAAELLEYLAAGGIPTALASSSRRNSIERMLSAAGFRPYFSVIVSGDSVTHSKPAPDIYLKACRELGATPGNVFAIEDSYNGIKSAATAGMRPIMVPDLLPPVPEITALTETVCASLTDVRQYLEAYDI